MRVRPEAERDRGAVHAVYRLAFDTAAEAELVDVLRNQAQPVISLVAEDNGEIVGHIMFSSAILNTSPASGCSRRPGSASIPGTACRWRCS